MTLDEIAAALAEQEKALVQLDASGVEGFLDKLSNLLREATVAREEAMLQVVQKYSDVTDKLHQLRTAAMSLTAAEKPENKDGTS